MLKVYSMQKYQQVLVQVVTCQCCVTHPSGLVRGIWLSLGEVQETSLGIKRDANSSLLGKSRMCVTPGWTLKSARLGTLTSLQVAWNWHHLHIAGIINTTQFLCSAPKGTLNSRMRYEGSKYRYLMNRVKIQSSCKVNKSLISSN